MLDFSSQICGDLERVSNFNPKKNANSGLSFGIKDDNLPNKTLEKTQDGWLEHPHVSKWENTNLHSWFIFLFAMAMFVFGGGVKYALPKFNMVHPEMGRPLGNKIPILAIIIFR